MSEASPEAKAFVLFSAGPAQRFIAAARTVRDLWTGSFLLSWLTRHAMEPIMQACGPKAFVLPDMSRDPMPLNGAAGKPDAESGFPLRVACLPNRFLAEVPEAKAEELAQQCQDQFLSAWKDIAAAVRNKLDREIAGSPLAADWQEAVQRLWQEQIDTFFDNQDVRVVVVRWGDFSQRDLEELLGPDTASSSANPADRLWRDRRQLAFRLLAAQKTIRKVTTYRPPADALGMYGPKCTLLGTYEQMGPAEVSKSARFWEEFANQIKLGGIRLRRGERLCGPSLVKRFAWPAYLAPRFGKAAWELWFEDTATVAAAEWLQKPPKINPQEIRKDYHDWNGQWLHWHRPDQDPDDPCPQEIWEKIWPILQENRKAQGPAPSYYAILMLDGDRMGKRLNECVGSEAVRRVSQTLARFALDHAETIVQHYKGTLIYCGGDDLLALVPTSQVLGCALKVRETFRQVWKAANLPCSEATLSAGIAIVHYKEDLRFALDQARQAEKQAKNAGRDILCITLCRRSGEHQTALCPWVFVETVGNWVKAFSPEENPSGRKTPGASDRWAYHLYQELPTLEGLPLEAMKAELRRQMDRAEEGTRKRLFAAEYKQAGEQLVHQFQQYHQKMVEQFSKNQQKKDDPHKDGEILRHFLTLCQMASFLARRREE